MNLPNWLAGLTGANRFANNPANGFRANLGDMAQAAGHSMLQHYRGKGGTYGGNPIIEGLNGGAGAATPIPKGEVTMGQMRAPVAPIQVSALPPAANAQVPFGMAPTGPAPAPTAWGQAQREPEVPPMIGGIGLPLLLRMGLLGGPR